MVGILELFFCRHNLDIEIFIWIYLRCVGQVGASGVFLIGARRLSLFE